MDSKSTHCLQIWLGCDEARATRDRARQNWVAVWIGINLQMACRGGRGAMMLGLHLTLLAREGPRSVVIRIGVNLHCACEVDWGAMRLGLHVILLAKEGRDLDRGK